MTMKQHTPGNTLAEYSFLIGLIALAAIGGLTLFGDSVSNLLSQASGNSGTNSIGNYINTVLGSGGGATAGVNGGVNSTGRPSGLPQENQRLLTESTGGGTNATSVEGTRGEAQVRGSLDKAQQLQALAEQESDPGNQAFLMNLAKGAYWVGGSQAAYEYHQNGVQRLSTLSVAIFDKQERDSESADKALISIRDNENFLKNDLDALLKAPNVSPEVKAKAKDIVNTVLSESQNGYRNLYQSIPPDQLPDTGLRTPTTVDKTTGLSALELVMSEGNNLLKNGGAKNTPAVQTSLEEGYNTSQYAQRF